MKKRLIFFVVISILLLFGFSYIPQKVIDTTPNKVAKIMVFNGTTGEEIEILDSTQIHHITQNLSNVTFQKGKPSFGYLGFTFRTMFYNQNGKVIEEFIINSDEQIRYKGFFYTTTKERIDFEYIEHLFKKGLD